MGTASYPAPPRPFPLDDLPLQRPFTANGAGSATAPLGVLTDIAPTTAMPRSRWLSRERLWWLALAGLWLLATAADRHWLALDHRLPAWDQADYLNSAVDHGRALGLLAGGGWQGISHLLDLSPKIPPLASLVNGTVMAVAGDGPDQASWALALWHGLLLLVVAMWGRDLAGRRFGLLAASLLALLPGLAELRLDYTLDLALAATTSLALWLLGRWLAPGRQGGGRWAGALAAAVAIAAAVLVKQSALLVLSLPSLWAVLRSLRRPHRLLQALAGLSLVLALTMPWLHHNWITTLGGTNRAVLESAAREGDPPVLSQASLLWYPRLWPQQLGLAVLLPALAGGGLGAWRNRRRLPAWLGDPLRALPPGWAWLIGCTLAAWLCTTLSPNKDPRYIAPLLPLLSLLLTRGWWQLGLEFRNRFGPLKTTGLLAAGLLGGAAVLAQERGAAVQQRSSAAAPTAMAELRRRVGETPVTLLVLPNAPDLNEQTLTTYGRLNGGQILARRLGSRASDHPLVLKRSDWLLLASGEQADGVDPQAAALAEQVRRDGRFQRVGQWPWYPGHGVELWQRRPEAPAERFDGSFIALARGMERGPAGVRELFRQIGAEHQLDGHFHYQERVRRWAEQRLRTSAQDPDALWSLALIETLRNRPQAALPWYRRLQEQSPGSPWPAAYRAVVLLADWHPGSAANVIHDSTDAAAHHPVMRALYNLSRGLVGHPLSLEALRVSVPEAIAAVKADLEAADAQPGSRPQGSAPHTSPARHAASKTPHR